MSLQSDLLAQAHHLATADTKKPKQANLRRSISSAYYSLFHLLCAECSRQFIGACPSGLQERVARALNHNEMKEACRSFSAAGSSAVLRALHPRPFSSEVRQVAKAFLDLQEARHRADYDRASSFTRAESLALHRKAADAHRAWSRIRKTQEATVFLAALLFAKRWDR